MAFGLLRGTHDFLWPDQSWSVSTWCHPNLRNILPDSYPSIWFTICKSWFLYCFYDFLYMQYLSTVFLSEESDPISVAVPGILYLTLNDLSNDNYSDRMARLIFRPLLSCCRYCYQRIRRLINSWEYQHKNSRNILRLGQRDILQ